MSRQVQRRVRRAALAGLLGSGLVLATGGCGGSDTGGTGSDQGSGSSPTASGASPSSASPSAASPSTAAPSSASASSQPDGPSAAAARVVVRTGPSAYGRMLFDGRQQAIYLFDREDGSRPRCYGDCAAAWPPVLAEGQPRAGGAVREGLLGTVERRDGSLQVTYAGHPLYYYAHEGPGQVLCHDVVEYGGTWLVVTPRGEPAPA